MLVRCLARPLSVGAIALVPALVGCKDGGKVQADRAAESASSLAKLVERDVDEVQRGLPEGAKRLSPLFAQGDPHALDAADVRRDLMAARRGVPDLDQAKSTFFAVADEKGIGIRNDLDEDVMAGQSLVAPFPEIGRARDAQGVVTTTGAFPGTPKKGEKGGPDRDWVAATAIRAGDGRVSGLYVTGWSYRQFAYHLKESLRHDLVEDAKKAGEPGKLPVFYVGVFDETGVYTAPLTPDINEKALAELDPVGKTASGPARGTTTIDQRDFGWAAVRVPKMCAACGVVVLRSEL